MGILNSIIHSYDNIWYGLLAAIVITAVVFIIIFNIQKKNLEFSPFSHAVGLGLIAFLTPQCASFIGAIDCYSDITDAGSFVTGLTSIIPLEEIPYDINSAGDALIDKVKNHIHWFMARRVLWSLLACVVGGILIYLSMERSKRRRVSGRRNASPGEGRRHARR